MEIQIRQVELKDINSQGANTMAEVLGIRFTAIGRNFLEAEMPVDRRTHQPRGILHGGASVALAETIGSVAATLCVDSTKFACVGLEINANHIRTMKSGMVVGRAEPLHIGRTTQVWEIKIRNADNKLVCISRLTMAVVPMEKI